MLKRRAYACYYAYALEHDTPSVLGDVLYIDLHTSIGFDLQVCGTQFATCHRLSATTASQFSAVISTVTISECLPHWAILVYKSI